MKHRPNDELSITWQYTDETNSSDELEFPDWLTRRNIPIAIMLFLLADRTGWLAIHAFPLPFEYFRAAGRVSADDVLGTAMLYPLLYHLFFAVMGVLALAIVLALTMRPAREVYLLVIRVVVRVVVTCVKFRLWRSDRVGIRANDAKEESLFFVQAKVPIMGLSFNDRRDIGREIATS